MGLNSDKKVLIIMGSARNGRNCVVISNWILNIAQKSYPSLSFEIVDLGQWDLPFDDEPSIPMTGKYESEKSLKWSKKVNEAQGVIIVSPQYNWGYPAILKNSLDRLYNEWKGKPLIIITYGGHGGSKCSEQLKQIAESLKMRTTATCPQLTLSRPSIVNGLKDPNSEFTKNIEDIKIALGEFSECLATISV